MRKKDFISDINYFIRICDKKDVVEKLVTYRRLISLDRCSREQLSKIIADGNRLMENTNKYWKQIKQINYIAKKKELGEVLTNELLECKRLLENPSINDEHKHCCSAIAENILSDIKDFKNKRNAGRKIEITEKKDIEMAYEILLHDITEAIKEGKVSKNDFYKLKEYVMYLNPENDYLDYSSKKMVADRAREIINAANGKRNHYEMLADKTSVMLDSYNMSQTIYYNLFRAKCILEADFMSDDAKRKSAAYASRYLRKVDNDNNSNNRTKSRHR